MRFCVSGREASGTMPLVRTFSLARLALAATFLATPGVLLAGVWDSTYAQAPLSLEPNQGQTDPVVDFIARGRGYSVFLTATGLVLSLQTKSTPAPPTVLRVELAGARASHAEGLDEQAGKSHYFLGNDPAKWRTNIPHFARVKYPGVYPGIDLVWYGNHGRLEYDFQLAAGADPRRIEFVFEGSDKIRIEPGGDLVVRVADHEFHHLRPVVYQQTEVGRRFISGRYVRRAERAVGFEVSGYDPRKPIVIDPVLAFSTFLGGDGQDSGHAVALDAGGNAYVTSATTSLDFPTRNPYQGANAGASDVSITKLDPTGTIMLYSTYLGGSGTENDFRAGVNASGIAVDAAGNAYVTGRTASPDFPVVNALQASFRGGDYDAFVAKLSPDGGALLYSTYLGGAASDSGNGIASDPAGNVYVVGGTRSDDYPITAGAFQQFPGGQLDAYVTKIDPTQSGAASLVYSTYLGGLGIDRGTSVVVDSAGNAYVTGRTESPDFPTQNPFQSVYGGGADAFVAKLNASGTALAYSTFLGGSGLDVGNGIALDSAGNVYVTGETASGTFPTQNAFQASHGGSSDAFVVGLNASGSALVYGTYLGGAGSDRGNSLAVDPTGKIYVVGDTTSVNFPLLSALQGQNAGGKDAFVAELDPGQAGAASLVYSSYLGGAGDDAGLGITVDSSGEAWITGETGSADWPTANPLQAVFGGGPSDAFVARIARGSGSPEFVVSGDPSSRTIMPESTATYTVTVTPSGGFRGSIDLSISGLPANSSAVFAPATVLIVDASPQSSTLTVSTEASLPPGTFPLTVTGTGATVQHTATVSLVISNSRHGGSRRHENHCCRDRDHGDRCPAGCRPRVRHTESRDLQRHDDDHAKIPKQ